MLSSEVERTLVKSPPELWAELSDPASLARHLGELGEIRITRVHPEEAVEWEANDDTRGTVHITPSGWGTKVTLTVTRNATSEPADEHEPAGAHVEEPVTVAEPLAAEEPLTAAEPATSEAESLAAEEPLTAAEPATSEAEPEEAEPSVLDEELPAVERHALRAHTVAGVESVVPLGLELRVHGAFEPMAHPEPEIPLDGDPEPPTRRGFFARLFRRGRREEPLDHAYEHVETYERVSAYEEDDPYEHAEHYEELDAYEHSDTYEHIDTREQIDPYQDEHTYEDVETMGPPEEVEEGLADDEFTHEPHELSTSHIEAPAANAPEPGGANPETGGHEDAGVSASTGESAEPGLSGDEGADPDAKERERADLDPERVESVLTAVLDRLGAAHHRPFSRP